MLAAFAQALVPIALLIALGTGLRRVLLAQEVFWSQAERLCYYLLLPCLLFHGLVTTRFDGVPVGPMAAVLCLSTVAVAAVLVAARRFVPGDDAAFTSIFQGAIRFNNYVGVSAAIAIIGPAGAALAAMANAIIIPTVNVLCVLVFARYGKAGRLSVMQVARQLALNPLVVACALGIAAHAAGLALPAVVEPALKSLGQASLPLGLLCVGAALNFSSAASWARPVAIASVVKFGLMPLVTALACLAFGLTGPVALAALIFQALPTASSAYIMSRQLGGDAPLMAGITATQTLLAAVAWPLAVIGFLKLLS